MGKKKEKVKKKICFLGSLLQVETIDKIANYLELTGVVKVIYKPRKKDWEFLGYHHIIEDRFNAIKDADEVIIIQHGKVDKVDRELLYEKAFAEHIGTPVTILRPEQVRLMCHLNSVAIGEEEV